MADASGPTAALKRLKEASACQLGRSVLSKKPASFAPASIERAIRGPSPSLAWPAPRSRRTGCRVSTRFEQRGGGVEEVPHLVGDGGVGEGDPGARYGPRCRRPRPAS